MDIEQEILTFANHKIQKFLDKLLKDIKNEYMNRSSTLSHQSTTQTCPFILSTGHRKGERCDIALKSGQTFCKRHSHLIATRNTDNNDERKSSRRLIVESESESEEESESFEVDINDSFQCQSYLIRKNKFNNFVFKDTDYIIKGPKEKFVVAREGLNGEWIPLTEEDRQICKKKYKLRCKEVVFTKKSSFDSDFIREQIKLPYERPIQNENEKWISVSKQKIQQTSTDSSSDEIEIDISDLQL